MGLLINGVVKITLCREGGSERKELDFSAATQLWALLEQYWLEQMSASWVIIQIRVYNTYTYMYTCSH